jgi:hypothetical protein
MLRNKLKCPENESRRFLGNIFEREPFYPSIPVLFLVRVFLFCVLVCCPNIKETRVDGRTSRQADEKRRKWLPLHYHCEQREKEILTQQGTPSQLASHPLFSSLPSMAASRETPLARAAISQRSGKRHQIRQNDAPVPPPSLFLSFSSTQLAKLH